MTKSNKSRKFIATSATAALVASAIVPVASAAQINDFNSIAPFAQEAVQDLNDRGVIKGDQKGNFNPKNNVTRAEAATILTNALGLEGSGSTKFADVKTSAWYYDAIDAAVSNGIFQGQGAGKFNPSGNLTRSEAAIILVDAFGLEGTADLSQFKDSASVKSWAQEALEIAVANEVMKGDGGNLKPNASISRQEFAVMYHRTEALETTEEETVAGSVKAINNTTVEVTFEEEVTNLNDLDFAIEGLTISNKAVKQTNKKTVVLTTSAQTADVEYTVTVDGEAVGTFKGLSAVIPTAVDLVEKSQQNVLGNQVTVKAKVTVATGESAAGIPVTFNIVNNSNINTATLNQPIVAEAKTDENGVATYTYTRYAATSNQLATSDEVQAYATGKPAARSFAKVYWANIQPLAITETVTGTAINNGSKKVYKVKVALEHAEKRAIGDVNASTHPYQVNLGFKENLNVTPDKAVKNVTVTDAFGTNLGYPGQWTTTAQNGNQVKIILDKNGEGTFTLSGSNATVTPFAFVDQESKVANAADVKNRFDATELFAQAPAITFSKSHNLAIALEAKGVEAAAKYNVVPVLDAKGNLPRNTGGRSYVATIADLQGVTAGSKTPVYVSVTKGNSKSANNVANVYVYDEIGKKLHSVTYVNDKATPILLNTDAKGQVKFKLLGDVDSYATPTVFVDSGDKTGQLDNNDLQQVGSIVYFGDVKVEKARLTVGDEAEVTVNVSEETEFIYETVDQNDNPYYIPGVPAYTATFDLTASYNTATASAGTYGTATAGLGTIHQDNHKVVVVQSDAQGRASVKVEAASGTRVTTNVSGSTIALPNLTATAIFQNLSNEGATNFTGKLLAVDTANNRLLATTASGLVYELKYATSELRLGNDTQTVDETTFASKVGKVFTFKQKTDATAAVFTVSANENSLIDTTSANTVLSTITINADQTPTAKVYDFGGLALKSNIKVSGENVTIQNLVLDGTITVGDAATSTNSINYVDDFNVDNVTGNVTVILNNGDGHTFNVTGTSVLTKVVANRPEHIEVGTGSAITLLDAYANVTLTGLGTVQTLVLNDTAKLEGDSTLAPAKVTEVDNSTVPVTAVATADSVTFTFSKALTASDVVGVNVITTTTTGETATVATLDTATATDTSKKYTFVSPLVAGQIIEITLNGVKYRATYTASKLTFVRFN